MFGKKRQKGSNPLPSHPQQDRVRGIIRCPAMEVERMKEAWEMTKAEWDYSNPIKQRLLIDKMGIEPPVRQRTEKIKKLVYKDKTTPGGGQVEAASIKSYRDIKHGDIIQKALSEGKPIPPEVLEDYPDLMELREAKCIKS